MAQTAVQPSATHEHPTHKFFSPGFEKWALKMCTGSGGSAQIYKEIFQK